MNKTETELFALYTKQSDLYDLIRELETKILETRPGSAPQLIWNPELGSTVYADKAAVLQVLEGYVVEITKLNIEISAAENRKEKAYRKFYLKLFRK